MIYTVMDMDEYAKYVAVNRLKALEKELAYKGNDDLRLPHLDDLRREVRSALDKIEKS
jgi:hypothetical protein